MALSNMRLGEVLSGVRLWEGLDQYAMQDKVINVRFERKKPGTDFVIRSDYEVAFYNDGSPHFIPIKQKPSISVTYRQVSNSVAIQVDVRVANLFFMNEKVGQSIFSNKENPVVQMHIQMGYKSQFPDWTTSILSSDREGDKESINRLDLFYSMGDFNIKNSSDVLDSALQIRAQVLATYREGIPPDHVTYFQGIVGYTTQGLKFKDRQNLKDFYSNETNFPAREDIDAPYTEIEKVFFTHITRRFIAPIFRYRLYDPDYDPNGDSAPDYRVFVRDYDAEEKRILDDEEQKGKPESFEEDGRWAELELDNGLLSAEDALVLGTQVYVSKALREASERNRIARSSPDGTAEFWTELPDNTKIPAVGFQQEANSQMVKIQEAYPSMRWTMRTDGSILAYDRSETIEELDDDQLLSSAMRHARPMILPAVYDISFSGVRTIRCPFISFVAPGQKVGFMSKYSIGSLTGFYYPHPEDEWFLVIFVDIDFDTDGNANTMTLTCVDTKPPPEALATPEDDEGEAEEKTTEAARKRSLTWVKKKIVRKYLTHVEETKINSWHGLAKAFVLENAKLSGVEDVPQREDGLEAAMDFLIDHNKDLNTKWQARGKGLEAQNYPDLTEWPSILYIDDVVEVPDAILEEEDEQA